MEKVEQMRTGLIFLAAAALAACAAPVDQESQSAQPSVIAAELQQEEPQSPPASDEGTQMMPESPPEPPKETAQAEQPAYKVTPEGVFGLPASDGQTFASLDAYLAHLEIKGHTDRPFWERMKDGRYRWNTGRGMQFREPKYATREELMAKYGFQE